MCEPATIATVALVAGGTMQAYSQYQQGKYQQAMGDYNAKVAEIQAQDALARGGIEEDRQRARTRMIMGAQRAAMGSSGAEVDTGSFGNVLEQTATMGEQDAMTIRQNAMRQAWGYESQADVDRFQGAAAKSTGTMNAMGSLLTTGGQAYGMYNKWWQKPATS